VSIEEHLRYMAEDPFGPCDKNSLRKFAVEVRKLEDRVKQLEQENDALRADLLLWNEKEVKL
jgi:hypothetical protein